MAEDKSFDDLLSSKESKMAGALDSLVEQLNNNKEKTIFNFLGNSGSEDFLWALVTMLSSKTIRIASNAAYVIGSLAETELGSHRVLSLTHGQKAVSILQDLTHMLTVEDAETVMNAAGTLGTLAETSEGREWMLKQSCMEEMMTNITFLLGSDNHWTASNSALVLARITISETGSQAILEHPRSKYMMTRLIQSLGNDTAGRGMNAAFAIGRLLDTKRGKEKLLNCPESEKMITSLCRMLSKGDMGGAKNACFAVSCLATDVDGNQRVLACSLFQDVINRLVSLLSNNDDTEAAWFAAMTLRTLTTHKQGVLRLRQNSEVESVLIKAQDKPQNSKDLNDEIHKTLMHLKKLDQPEPPKVQISGPTSVKIEWSPVNTHSGLQITYKLYSDNKVLYKGRDLQCSLNDLNPHTSYSFKIRASTLGDDSPFSEVTSITTEEDVPSAPTFFRLVGATPTQLRLTWSPPEHPNGVLRGYTVYLGEKTVESTNDLSYIITRLSPATRYTVHVCASTLKGVGERATVEAMTEELGAHAPEKPGATVIGRNEIHVAWFPPAVPLGRFFRYELLMNDRVVYHGTDRVFKATGLTPDTEYIFVVVAITSEGRCMSDPTKKRTHKDKPQNEPGHHKLKTHSFMAKEFQIMQEKSKTQPNLTPPQKSKPKLKKRNSNRPASTISSSGISETSGFTDGTWAHSVAEPNEGQEKLQQNQIQEERQPFKRFDNPAILGGRPQHKASSARNENVVPEMALGSTNGDIHGHSSKTTEERTNGPTQNNEVNRSAWGKGQRVNHSAREFSFSKENAPPQAKTGGSHPQSRLHKSHTMSKPSALAKGRGRAVSLSSENHTLSGQNKPVRSALMQTTQNQTGAGQHKPVKSGLGQQVTSYYPDIVSQIRQRYVDRVGDGPPENSPRRKSSDTPDSLEAEPGTARVDVDVVRLDQNQPEPEVPHIKQRLPPYLPRETHMNEYQMHEIARRKGYPFRVHHPYPAPKLSTKATSIYADHIILKSTTACKYGLKYTPHHHNSESSASSVDNDSAFQSLSHAHEGQEDGFSHSLQKPLQLKPIKSDAASTVSRTSSEHQAYKDAESRLLPSRLKTPPKGYWSDHDVHPSKSKKKISSLTPINYRMFTGAHRPTKSIRLESPLVTNSDTWFGNDGVATGDNNKYKFIPTQFRTQPANLPIVIKTGKGASRLESINSAHLRTDLMDRSLRTKTASSGTHSPSPPRRSQNGLRNPRRLANNTITDNADKAVYGNVYTDRLKPATHDTRNLISTDMLLRNNDFATRSYGRKLSPNLLGVNLSRSADFGGRYTSAAPPPRIVIKNRDFKGSPTATGTSVPHTILSPLSDSSSTPMSKFSSTTTDASVPKSPRLRMTSSSSSPYFQQTIPTVSGYNVSPSNSLSPILSNDHKINHVGVPRQMAMVQGGGDPV